MKKKYDDSVFPPLTKPDICHICLKRTHLACSLDYLRCPECGHETLAVSPEQKFIINDNIEQPARFDIRDAFLRDISRKATVKHDFLLDIGCGSGRFLNLNKLIFKDHLGIEITDAAAEFATRHWKVKVKKYLPEKITTPSLITFWHSLEHIPPDECTVLLNRLLSISAGYTRIIICVPNALSWQAKIFRRDWAYYDPPAHVRQFTPLSLEKLMTTHNFVKDRRFFAFIYELTGWVLGIINLLTPGRNYFYYRAKRGEKSKYGSVTTAMLDLLCYASAVILIIPSALLSFLAMLRPDSQTVITYSFKPKL